MKEDGQYYAPEGVEFPASLWQTPASERYEALDRGEIKAYFIQSVDDTKVFCYVGLPEGASAEEPVPAVVLVHGALGTAFYDWVRAWNDRGYAAVAMDTEGRMPKTDTSTYNAVYETSVMPHGPANASFTDCTKPIGEQWVYHALASVIASASFLKSFAGVDSSRMGITGVSYGGFLTCLAVGYDDRYAFAAPVYGCLSNAEGAGEFGSYIRNNEGADLWDDTGALAAGNAPILFVNSDTDTHFTLDSMARCIRAAKYGAATVIPGLTHGHAQGCRGQGSVRLCRRNLFENDSARPRSDLPRKRRDRDRRARKRKGFRGCTALYSFGNRRFVDRVGGRKSHAKRQDTVSFPAEKYKQALLISFFATAAVYMRRAFSFEKTGSRGGTFAAPLSYYYSKTLIT